MFNDYGLADVAWQRQREAERAAAAHRLAVLAEQGAEAAAAAAGRLSLRPRDQGARMPGDQGTRGPAGISDVSLVPWPLGPL